MFGLLVTGCAAWLVADRGSFFYVTQETNTYSVFIIHKVTVTEKMQRKRHRDRETERQIGRETERQRDKETKTKKKGRLSI